MKEVWVKKTIWRRYLVKNSEINEATRILEKNDRADELIADCFDINETVEYDNEEVIIPVQFTVQDI